MFIIQDGKITSEKTLDIGKIRVINLVFKSDLDFADDDKFKLVLGSIQSENYAFVDDGCLRFSYVDVADVIKSQSANFAVQILHNGVQILADTITVTAVIQGGGQIVLPDVTVTADKMLKDITAINTDGAVVTGNIENAVVTTDETDGLTVNISKGYVSADQAKNFDPSTVTETDTQVTVSRGWLKEDKTFSVGGGSSDVQGIVFNGPARFATEVKIIPSDLTKDWTDFSYMFYSCKGLTSIPLIDTSNGTNFSYMFASCGLTSIPLIDTSNGTNFSYMFQGSSVTSIPLIDTSNGTNFSYMFASSSVTSIPLIDTSNGTNFINMFDGCSAVKTIPQIDVSGNRNHYSGLTYILRGCRALENFGGLLNVAKSFTLSACTALTHESLLNVLNGLYDLTGSTSQTLTLGSDNLAKLTDQEKAIATNKNWTLA